MSFNLPRTHQVSNIKCKAGTYQLSTQEFKTFLSRIWKGFSFLVGNPVRIMLQDFVTVHMYASAIHINTITVYMNHMYDMYDMYDMCDCRTCTTA